MDYTFTMSETITEVKENVQKLIDTVAALKKKNKEQADEIARLNAEIEEIDKALIAAEAEASSSEK